MTLETDINVDVLHLFRIETSLSAYGLWCVWLSPLSSPFRFPASSHPASAETIEFIPWFITAE
jgi:hypothetical protein